MSRPDLRIATWNREHQGKLEFLIAEHPNFVLLRAQVAEAVKVDDRFAAHNIIERFFDQNFRWLIEWFIFSLQGTISNNNAIMPFPMAIYAPDTPFSSCQLFTDSNIAVQLTSISPLEFTKRRQGRIIQFSGQTDFYHLIVGHDVKFRKWSCQEFSDTTDLLTLTCRLDEGVALTQDSVLCIDGRRETVSVQTFDVPSLYLQISLVSWASDFLVDFDSESLNFTEAHPRNRTAARKMFLMTALREMGDDERGDILINFAKEGPFFQRWYAARELLVADRERAIPVIADMAEHDPNPSIKRTAAETIEWLSKSI